VEGCPSTMLWSRVSEGRGNVFIGGEEWGEPKGGDN
jgi:hypothetical protein